jgi:hypothetical protein
MTAHYSRFLLNTYSGTPYFASQMPKGYPLDFILQQARSFRRLPPNLRELANRAGDWAVRHDAIPYDIENYYDGDGNELDPRDGHKMTDKEIDADWQRLGYRVTTGRLIDIPIPPGGFADPKTWEPPPRPRVEVKRDIPLNEEILRREMKERGREWVIRTYGLTEDEIPR